MRNSLKKTVVASLAALAIGAATLGVATTPASAGQVWHGGGFHGGWHGGYHGGWHSGYGWGALGVLGAAGIVTGAIVASQAPYYNDCTGYQPVYDAYGNYLGQRPVNVCY